LDQKSQNVQKLQQEKNSNKWQIEKQKIVDEFEKMKKTGKLDYKSLKRMGVELPTKKEIKENLKQKGSRSGFSMSQSMGLIQNGEIDNTNNNLSTIQPRNNHNTVKTADSTSNGQINNQKILNNKSKSKIDSNDNNNNNPKPLKPTALKQKVATPEKFKASPYTKKNNVLKQSPIPLAKIAKHTPASDIFKKDSGKTIQIKSAIPLPIHKNSGKQNVKSGANTKRSQDSSGMQFIIK
jgi:hypothetical protein